MKNLQKSRTAVFILGIILAACAFLTGLISADSPEKINTSDAPVLPQGVHFPVNINTVDESTLCLLEGIGDVRASRIVQYRNLHGDFKSEEDIMLVEGIGEKTYNKIKSYIYAE